MEKFILCGLDQGKSQIKLHLPIAKHFVLNAVKNGEKVLKVNELVAEAVKSNDRDFNHIWEVVMSARMFLKLCSMF